MGEDFIRKRSRQFRTSRDKAFIEFQSRNLYSNVDPSTSTKLVGAVRDGAQLERGRVLWPMEERGSSRVILCDGQRQAVELNGAAAALFRKMEKDSGRMLTAEVVEVLSDGLVRVSPQEPYPPT